MTDIIDRLHGMDTGDDHTMQQLLIDAAAEIENSDDLIARLQDELVAEIRNPRDPNHLTEYTEYERWLSY
jgi:hypothetical protein